MAKGEWERPEEIRRIPWVGYANASHVILAGLPDGSGGGIEATALCELDAHRIAKLYRKHGYRNVKVRPYSEEKRGELQPEIDTYFSALIYGG